MLKNKLEIELERLNKINEEYTRIQSYAQNLERELLLINGRIQVLNELINEEEQPVTEEEVKSI
ncbi:hypothetical protein D3C81_679280 [compost metagenome]